MTGTASLHALRDALARLPQVEAVALGGSRARTAVPADPHSDVDVYVFTRADIALADRQRIVAALGGRSVRLDQRFWGLSDEWVDPATGITVDLTHFDAGWMQDALERVLLHHRASLGRTTCFWHTLRQATPLFDRDGWLAGRQALARGPYPEALRQAIIDLNHPVLRGIGTAYVAQIAKAVARHDAVSVNHRLAALLASYFDCVFAACRVPHPGEKRLIELALAAGPGAPPHLAEDVGEALRLAAVDPPALVPALHRLLDRLDEALVGAGLDLPGAAA